MPKVTHRNIPVRTKGNITDERGRIAGTTVTSSMDSSVVTSTPSTAAALSPSIELQQTTSLQPNHANLSAEPTHVTTSGEEDASLLKTARSGDQVGAQKKNVYPANASHNLKTSPNTLSSSKSNAASQPHYHPDNTSTNNPNTHSSNDRANPNTNILKINASAITNTMSYRSSTHNPQHFNRREGTSKQVCTYFEKTGSCHYGSSCRYSHGSTTHKA